MADWFDENAPPPQDDWFAQNAPTAVAQPLAAPQTTPSDSGFTFLPKSGAQMDVGEARQVAEIPAVQNAAQGALETAASFVPKSVGEVAGLAGSFLPPVQAVQDIGSGIGELHDVLFGDKTDKEIMSQRFPETQVIPEAEKTPPFSKERFKAGFGTLAQFAMAAGVGRGLTPKPSTLSETLGFTEKPPEVLQAENESLAQLEQPTEPAPSVPAATESTTNVLGKQEPVTPDLPSGTGESQLEKGINEEIGIGQGTQQVSQTQGGIVRGVEAARSPESESPMGAAPSGRGIPISGDKIPIDGGETLPRRVTVWKAQRQVGDIKEGPKLGEFYTSSEQTAKSLSDLKGDVTQHELVLNKPFTIPAKEEGHHFYDVSELNDLLKQGGVKIKLPEDMGIEPVWRHIDEGGTKLVNALKKAGYDSIQYPEFLGRKDQTTTLVFKGKPSPVPAPVSTTAPLSTQTGEANAIQEPSTGAILQRQPEETGTTGSERVGVEPSVQGQETPEARQGTEAQPQEVARPEPEVSTFSVETPKDAFGTEQTPVANFLMTGDGVMSKSTAKRNGLYQKNPALWENAPQLSHPTHGKLYGSTKVAVLDKTGKPTGKFRSVGEGGETPDKAAQALYEQGLIPDAYPDTMWNALDKESKSARSTLKSQQGQFKDVQKQSGQTKDFGQAQHDSWKQGEPAVQVKDLQVGDTVTVKGQELKVTDIDPDNFDVTLEDGRKFGVQTVKDNTVIYGEHKPVAQKPVSEPFDMGRAGRENKAQFDKAIQAAGTDQTASIEMQSPTHPGLRVLITPDVESGKWRATRVDDKGPVGHNIFDSREQAISDYTGGAIQSHAAYGRDFVVKEVRTASTAQPLPKAPKLLAGENQGDLLSSTQSEPLKLVGEKGTDFGAQQAASEKATAERAQSEKGQMQLGETPPTKPPPISTKNAYTEQQRAIRGMPEAEQAAKRGFGKVWDEAAAEAQKDPTIGRRLVAEINSKPRPISDIENAHLLRREIEAQKEHNDAIDAVNNAKTDADLTAAKARLEVARNELQDVYDATKSAGTKGGQALAARQMLAKEDYSLAKMEARRRAANNGQPLSEQQLAETSELHAKIADLQSKLDAHEVATQFNNEFNKLVEQSKKDARASKATGTRFTDFMDRKANEARSRIAERRGRLTTGFDPTAITDEAVIGASHIAKGLTNFADWSVKMAEEFGDQVRPFLKDIWERAKAFHDANAKEYGDKALSRYKTYLGKQTEQIKGKLEAGDFTKAQRQKTQLDKEAFVMRADLQKLKNQFERGVAKEVYKNKTPAQKFWDHFVGVERAMKLSGPEVFGKLGTAAAVREVLAPIEAAGGYGVSKVFPKLAKGTRYEADAATVLRSEIKAKASLFTEGMRDAWQNVKGQETGLDALGKTKIRPDFWYNRIGQMHAAIKAPVKRAEFTRSLEKGMAVAIKNGEDINHPEVMTRLANEAVMESNRAIFQNKTVVSGFFSMLERQSPVAGRAGRFFFPVVKIPVNIFKELVNLHVGAPIGAARVGMAYWKGVETLPALQREAIIRQLTKGSIGGAGLLWGYYNRDKVRNFFDHAPTWFQHTPMAMILNEGSYLKGIQAGGDQAKQSRKELAYMAKTDIPFMYTIKDIGDALDTHNSHALLGWINNMTQSTVVPQILTQTAKQMDKPGTFPSNIGEKPTFRPPSNPVQAIKAGIPGLRQTVPVGGKKAVNVSRRR